MKGSVYHHIMDAELLETLRRNSNIRLAQDGAFWWGSARVPNTRVQALFHRGLRRRDSDHELTMHVGDTWCYVTCEGVYRFVKSLQVSNHALRIRLRHGQTLNLDQPQLVIAPDERFYLWLKTDQTFALLERTAHQQLIGHLEPARAHTELELVVGERHHPVITLDDVPTWTSAWPVTQQGTPPS